MPLLRNVLVQLARLDKSDFDGSLRRILLGAASALNVERVSFWHLRPDRSALQCEKLVRLSSGAVEQGTELAARDFPAYFAALRESRSIVAHHAESDPRTCELTEAYLRPLGVASLLDVPVWHAGRLYGVLCHEHVGVARRWTAEEHDFATSIAELVSVAVEARLRHRAEERFTVLSRATDDLFWELDLHTHHIEWADGAASVLKVPQEVLMGVDWYVGRVHPDDRARVDAGLSATVAGERVSWNDEYRWQCPDGAWLTLSVRGFLVRDAAGAPVRLLGAVSDVTEHRRLESRLQLRDRMASVGTLAAGVAHEINNPLSFIKSNLEFALTELKEAGHASSEVIEALSDALDGAGRVRSIVAGMKSFSRPADGTGPIALNDVVESSLRMAWNELRHRAVVVKELQQTPEVMGEECRLGQVVLNLVINAAQAMNKGSAADHRLTVRTFTNPKGWAVLEVEDTGPGIPPELRSRVFDPFFTTKPIGEGTGLGLSVCHGLVSGMGGEITLDDGAHGGCLMRVSLPPAPEERDGSAPPGAALLPELPAGLAPRPRVLVVDDERQVGSALKRILGRDHQVEIAEGARAALELINRGERYDVILCDVMMPEMSGPDFVKELEREARPEAGRSVFMSGGVFASPAAQLQAIQAQGVVEKPFDERMLREAIRAKLSLNPAYP